LIENGQDKDKEVEGSGSLPNSTTGQSNESQSLTQRHEADTHKIMFPSNDASHTERVIEIAEPEICESFGSSE